MNWGYWDSDWECVNATIVLTKRGYDIFSKRAIERGLFPGLFLGHGQSESTGLCMPDEGTTMVWTTESVPHVLKKIGLITKHNYAGIRHRKAEKQGILTPMGTALPQSGSSLEEHKKSSSPPR